MISSLRCMVPSCHQCSRSVLEEDVSLLCGLYVPSIQETHAISARMERRRRTLRHLLKTIIDQEARLQQLYAQRDKLHMMNSTARALLASRLIAGKAVEDDPAVLATDYKPDSEEFAAIKARLDARYLHIYCMKRAIHTEQTNPDIETALLSQIDVLQKSCVVGKHILAPMRSLPAEILGYIFTLAVPPLNLDPLIYDHGNRRVPLYPDEPHPHEVRTRISQVCRKWRQVAKTTPRMWTTLAFNFPLPQDIYPIARCFKNSKACQLELFFTISQWFDSEDASLIPHVLRLIRNESKRIRVFVSQANTQDHFTYLYPLQMHTRALSMELCSVEQFDPVEPEILLGSINAPRLETLILLGAYKSLVSFASTSFLHVKRLIIGGPFAEAPWELWLKVFSSCPGLEVLHLTLQGLEQSGQWDRVSLPLLTELVLRTEDPMALPQMLNCLHIPALNFLEIYPCTGSPFITNVFDSLSDTVTTSLRHVRLFCVDFIGEGVAQVLRRLTNIQSFHIVDSSVDEILFNTLIPPNGSDPESWVCPSLREFDLTGTSVVGDELLRLIDTRTLPDLAEPKPHYLTTLKLINCGGLGVQHLERFLQLENTHANTLEFFTSVQSGSFY